MVGLSCIENPSKLTAQLVSMSNQPLPETETIFWSDIRATRKRWNRRGWYPWVPSENCSTVLNPIPGWRWTIFEDADLNTRTIPTYHVPYGFPRNGKCVTKPVLTRDNINIDFVITIASGMGHNFVLLRCIRFLYCTGRGEYGSLGQGNTEDSLTRVFAHLGLDFGRITAVECGRIPTYALRDDGTSFSWGDGFGFVLGSGNVFDRILSGPVNQTNIPPPTLFFNSTT